MFRNEDNNRLAGKGRSSVCKSGVQNLGNNPRVYGAEEDGGDGISMEMPSRRKARNQRPSHRMLLETLLKCVPIRLPHGEGRGAVASRFREAMKGGKGADVGGSLVCGTPLRWISEALPPEYDVSRVRSLDDIMGQQGMMAGNGDFFLMDVILNRELQRSAEDARPRDPDDVVMASAKWDGANLEPDSDFKYRAVVAYLPGAGVFYCSRERRPAAVGLPNTPVHHDVSWLRISEDIGALPMAKRFSFGADGFVRRFSEESADWVSAWRVSYATYGAERCPPRLVFRARQCSDSDGPRMPPDILGEVDISHLPAAERRVRYNSHLASSTAAKVGCRHYARGSRHRVIPDDCLVINGDDTGPHFDVVVEVAPRGSFRAHRSVVRVRNILSPGMESNFVGRSGEPLLTHELRIIALHNTILRKRLSIGRGRSNKGDIGAMHPIGTKVNNDRLSSTVYSATRKVSRQLVRAYVNALSRVGQIVFPDVLAVIQDTEGDTGFKPCAAMAGDAVGNRVGMSIDASVNLANASHFDSNDASQGYSLFLEEVPGMADSWYFVMPNVHGIRPDGSGSFNGLAIKIRHGTAISWDGRVIRHCTSVSRPDGPETPFASGPGRKKTTNHLFGTFTAAKEKIVHAGRGRATEIMCRGEGFGFHVEDEREEWPPYNPTVMDADPDDDPVPKDPGDWDWHWSERRRERDGKRELLPRVPSGMLNYIIPKKRRLI